MLLFLSINNDSKMWIVQIVSELMRKRHGRLQAFYLKLYVTRLRL